MASNEGQPGAAPADAIAGRGRAGARPDRGGGRGHPAARSWPRSLGQYLRALVRPGAGRRRRRPARRDRPRRGHGRVHDRQPEPRLPLGRRTWSTCSTRVRSSSCWRWARASSCCSARSTSRSATSPRSVGSSPPSSSSPTRTGPGRAAIVAGAASSAPPSALLQGIAHHPAADARLRRHAGRLPDLVRRDDRHARHRRRRQHHGRPARTSRPCTASSTATSIRSSAGSGSWSIVGVCSARPCGGATPGAAAAASSPRRWA